MSAHDGNDAAVLRRVYAFVDTENIRIEARKRGRDVVVFKQLVELIHRLGDTCKITAYGDYSQGECHQLQQTLQELGCHTKQSSQRQNGTWRTDIELSLDALEVVIDNQAAPGVLAIASGDGDFVEITSRAKSRGWEVVGVGVRGNASGRLQTACNRWEWLQDGEPVGEGDRDRQLVEAGMEANDGTGAHSPGPTVGPRTVGLDRYADLLVQAVSQLPNSHPDCRCAGAVNAMMSDLDPSFDFRELGFSKFVQFCRRVAEIRPIELDHDGTKCNIVLHGHPSDTTAQSEDIVDYLFKWLDENGAATIGQMNQELERYAVEKHGGEMAHLGKGIVRLLNEAKMFMDEHKVSRQIWNQTDRNLLPYGERSEWSRLVKARYGLGLVRQE